MSDFRKLFEAIAPEDVFKPASQEELASRPEATETMEMRVGSKVYHLVHFMDSGKSVLIAKDDEYEDFTLATFSRGGVEVPDGMAMLDFLQELMGELGEDITDG